MADFKEPFIHLFRDPESFAKLAETEAWKKFTTEAEQTRKLWKDAGVPSDGIYNPEAAMHETCGVEALYSKLERLSSEYNVLVDWFGDGKVWPELHAGTVVVTKALQEIAFVRQYAFFTKIFFFWSDNAQTGLLVGCIGEDRYPLVYWGSEQIFNETREKLAKLEEAKNQPAEAVAVKSSSKVLSLTATILTVALVGVGGMAAIYYLQMGVSKAAQTSQQISAADKEAAGQLAFHNSKCHATILATSSDQLPSGIVSYKLNCVCRYCDGGHYYLVYVKKGGDFLNVERRVSKGAFDSLRVGDVLPPKPKPKPPHSEDF